MKLAEKVSIIMRDLEAKHGDILNAKIPGTTVLMKEYNIRLEMAMKLNRKLRYAFDDEREKRCAEKLLHAAAKRQRCKIHELSEIPTFPDDQRILQPIIGTVKVSEKAVVRHMKARMIVERKNLPNSDEQLKKHIDSQDWPNLCIRTCEDTDKGEGVFSGNLPFAKGSVVCDYHGRDCTAKEGREVMKNVEGEEGNYVYFYTDRHGKNVCKDACTGCECHNEENFKLKIWQENNHSSAHPKPEDRLKTYN